MSLINEALKKAQQDRPEMSPAPPPGDPMPPPRPPQHQEKKKHRGFLWGFLLALVIVGAVSSLLAAFLVLQLLDPKSPEPEPEPGSTPVVQTESAPLPEAREASTIQEAEVLIEESSIPVPDEAKEMEPPSEAAPLVEDLQASPEITADAPIASIPEAEAVENQPIVKEIPAPPEPRLPNPDVIARLREVEIRGIMSGATKVLIHDISTGKTRGYTVGESMQGPLGLSIFKISNNSIQFKDYAGHIHTKSF